MKMVNMVNIFLLIIMIQHILNGWECKIGHLAQMDSNGWSPGSFGSYGSSESYSKSKDIIEITENIIIMAVIIEIINEDMVDMVDHININ